jgi:hypothetical protein
LWGGTILQWAVPLLLAAYFFVRRQTTAFAFSLFFFFENWLYTATYMADARAMVLPLVTTGDPDLAEHDWNTIFTSFGVLPYDTTVAAVVRFGGWCGMIATIAWLVWRAIGGAGDRVGGRSGGGERSEQGPPGTHLTNASVVGPEIGGFSA